MKQHLTLLVVLLSALVQFAHADDSSLRLSTFQIDVTPPLGSPLCNGNVKPAMEIVTPLTARGVVLLGAGNPIVLCAFDWVGIGNESYDQFRATLALAVGTTADRVALHTLHQHDAPGSDFATERLLADHGLARQYSNPDFDASVMERLGAAAKTPIVAADVGWMVKPVSLPLRSTLVQATLLEVLGDESKPKKARLRAARDLVFVRRMKRGHRIPISCLTLGKACILHMPGELFVEYQLAAQRMRPDRFVAMAAYGDYGPGYVGTRIAYDQGGYETGIVSRVGPEVEDILIKATRQLIGSQQVVEPGQTVLPK